MAHEEEMQRDMIDPQEREISTDWANPPTLADLKADLEEASSHHQGHVNQVNTWLDNLYITGAAKPSFRKGRSQVQPQLIRKQAEWRYAALSESFLSHEDLFTTEPVTYEDVNAAKQNGLILNNQWNTQIDKVGFIDEYVRAGVNEGSIIVRVGWDFETREVEVPNMVAKPIESPFKRQLVEQGAQMIMQDPDAAMQMLDPALMQTIQLSMEIGEIAELVQDGTKMETQTVKNQPTVEVCDYAAVTIDPTCKGDLTKAGFITFEWDTSRGELEKDGLYENLDLIKWGDAQTAKPTNSSSHAEQADFQFKDEPRKLVRAVEYWGFWDIEGDGKLVSFVATWIDDTMIRMELSPFPGNELPFVLVPYLPKRKSVYGEPDGSLLEENQKIAGAVTRGMIDIMGRSATGQVGYKKDALDITNQRKFDNGLDYQFNGHIDPRSAFHTHVYPEIPASAPFMLELQNNDAEAMTGVKAFSQGITGEGLGRSATAARSALDAAGKREIGILRRMAKGITDIGRKIIAMNAIFLDEEEVVRITNEEFVTVNKEDLDGKMNLKLKISTAESDDAKAQELAFMLQTVGNNLPPEFSLMIMQKIAELRKMPELAKSIETFEPQPDPIQQRMQELAVAREEAEIEKILSEAEENRAEAAKDLADAQLAGSKADKEDLDYLEQAEGVTQERALQKDGAQAEAQAKRDREKDFRQAAMKAAEGTAESQS